MGKTTLRSKDPKSSKLSQTRSFSNPLSQNSQFTIEIIIMANQQKFTELSGCFSQLSFISPLNSTVPQDVEMSAPSASVAPAAPSSSVAPAAPSSSVAPAAPFLPFVPAAPFLPFVPAAPFLPFVPLVPPSNVIPMQSRISARHRPERAIARQISNAGQRRRRVEGAIIMEPGTTLNIGGIRIIAAHRNSIPVRHGTHLLTVPTQQSFVANEPRPVDQSIVRTNPDNVRTSAMKFFMPKAPVIPIPRRSVPSAPLIPIPRRAVPTVIEWIQPSGPNDRASSHTDEDKQLIDLYATILENCGNAISDMRARIVSSYIPHFKCDNCHEDHVMVPGDKICKFCAYHLQKTHGKIEFDFYAERSDEEKIRLFGSMSEFKACKEAFEKDPVNDHVKKCNMCNLLTRGKWNACKTCGSNVVKPGVLRASNVLPRVYLTGCNVPGSEVVGRGITRVLTIGKAMEDPKDKDHVPSVQIPDCPDAEIMRIHANDTPEHRDLIRRELFKALKFIAECDKGVVVHCQAGASRSASVVLAYMMLVSPHVSLATAYCSLYRYRNIININIGFMDMLKRFKSLIDKNIAALDSIELQINHQNERRGDEGAMMF